VPAASVVAENVVAFEIARAWLDKFAGDTLREVRAAYEFYAAAVRALALTANTPRLPQADTNVGQTSGVPLQSRALQYGLMRRISDSGR
jgi:hypothetical protein